MTDDITKSKSHLCLIISCVCLFLTIILFVVIYLISFYSDSTRSSNSLLTSKDKISIAVLGDSDSHSYHDTILLSKPGLRGGRYRPTTLQWGEVLSRLRSNQLDLGKWGIWGSRAKIAYVLSAIGLEGRAPKKLDFRYNFAISGAECSDLNEGDYCQTQRLLYIMKKNPDRWQNGLIVIRIGVNSFAQTEHLDELAKNGLTPEFHGRVLNCLDYINKAVCEIRKYFPTARIVLVGIFDNSNWAPNLSKWQSPGELAHIREALDLFDNGLRTIVQQDKYMAFFDDRAWFMRNWGGRDGNGHPAYRSVRLCGGIPVTNSQGDHPRNAVVSDGHAGTVWNGLWASALIDLVNCKFNMKIEPISDAEIAVLADSEGSLQISSVCVRE